MRKGKIAVVEKPVYHYTNAKGYNGIRGKVWRFQANRQRPADKPYGAYFTFLRPTDPNFVKRLRLPKRKREFVFAFTGHEKLLRLPGSGGNYVLYSPIDYLVQKPRQQFAGMVSKCPFPGD